LWFGHDGRAWERRWSSFTEIGRREWWWSGVVVADGGGVEVSWQWL
jgi:hypothetical protein